MSLAAGLAGAGLVAERLVRLPAATLLGPMILTGALEAGGVLGGLAVPGLLREIAFTILGLRIGLRFTAAAVRLAGRRGRQAVDRRWTTGGNRVPNRPARPTLQRWRCSG